MSNFQAIESSSVRVNGVNADVPLDNDGGEKVVRALLVDDFGKMEKHPQMAKDKRIIIPFPFGFGCDDHKSNRKKRNVRTAKIFTVCTSFAIAIAGLFTGVVYDMNENTNKIGHCKTSHDYQKRLTLFITLTLIFLVISGLLLLIAFAQWLKCSRNGNVGAGTGTGR